MQVAILGNSGSGKSTLARWIAAEGKAVLLDLDTVAWEPGQIAVARPPVQGADDVRAFCRASDRWVVEGCYADLITAALDLEPTLLFLNPGEAQCVANCEARPWEQHKYPSREEQDSRLAFLLTWVRDYYTREGPMSFRAHRACFDQYHGNKLELTTQPGLTPMAADLRHFVFG